MHRGQATRSLSFLVCVSILGSSLAVSPQGFAQSKPADEEANYASLLEEIIVTAQRREENIQDIGMAIHAFTSEQIRDMRLPSGAQIAQHVPNVTVKTTIGSQNPVLSMRGISLNDENPNGNSPIGVYVDDVYLSSISMMSFQVFDTERIEVLMGPQGTLYGRNTSAGAIKYISKKPDSEFSSFVRFDLGNYETFKLEGAIGGQLSDTVNGRLAFFTNQQNKGHFINRLTGNDHGEVDVMAVRAMADWQISENLSVLLKIHAGSAESDIYFYEHLGFMDPATGAPCQAFLEGRVDPMTCTDAFGYSDPDGDPFSGDYNIEPSYESDAEGASITLNWNLERFDFTSITAFEDFNLNGTSEADASPFVYQEAFFNFDIEQLSQEFRLTSNVSDSFQWIAGVYGSHDEKSGNPGVSFKLDHLFATHLGPVFDQETDTVAVFAHGERQLEDRWRLLAGVRYTSEKLSYVGGSADLNPYGTSCILDPIACNPGLTGPFFITFADDSYSDSELTGDLSINYTPSDDRLYYARISSGYKAGGWDGGITLVSSALDRYLPETVTAWELGFKTRWPDRALQFNMAAFYNDFENMQFFAIPEGAATPLATLTNATEARTSGLEADLVWKPVGGLDLRLAMAYLNTENKDSRFAGNKLNNAPEWTGNATIRYQWQSGSEFKPYVQTRIRYTGDAYNSYAGNENSPIDLSPAFWLIDARAGVTSQDGRWEASVWAQNLLDEESFVNTFNGALLFGRNGWRIYQMPRTYGLSFTYHWD
jgi:iron complex outermembrane receptor protein